jgi:hypothetical protein
MPPTNCPSQCLLLTIRLSPSAPFWGPVQGQGYVNPYRLTKDIVSVASWLRLSPFIRIEVHVAVRLFEAERATACVDSVHQDCVASVQASVQFRITEQWVRWIQTCTQNWGYVNESYGGQKLGESSWRGWNRSVTVNVTWIFSIFEWGLAHSKIRKFYNVQYLSQSILRHWMP